MKKIKTKTNKKTSKPKTVAVVAAVTLLMVASGLTGYKLVKVGNYGGVEENLHEVERVVDGDTFEVVGEDGEKIIVRILNMATPDRGECFYDESKEALEKLLLGKEVKLEKDVSGVDSYGRFLRHVYLSSGTEDDDNIIVSKYMIENGWAEALPILPDVKYKTYLARFGTEAKDDKLGVWGGCKELPRNFAESENAQPLDKECVIKGNISQNNSEKIYFYPGCPSYSQIKINLKVGERYFCTEAEAKEAGFHISGGCRTVFRKK